MQIMNYQFVAIPCMVTKLPRYYSENCINMKFNDWDFEVMFSDYKLQNKRESNTIEKTLERYDYTRKSD